MNLAEKQNQFAGFFNEFEAWNEKFNYLLELGEALFPMPSHLKTPLNAISGCQSHTYFYASLIDDKLVIHGWSNSAILSGIIEMIRMLFNDVPVQQVRETPINFHTLIALPENLTPNRAAALQQMIDRITCLL